MTTTGAARPHTWANSMTESVAPSTAVLTLRQATLRLGGRTIWADVDLTVRPGEFVAVLGPNGVGKSTLLKAVLGLLPLAAGSMTVLGAEPGSRGAGRAIGYLPQRRSFDSSVRIRGLDVVRLGLDGHRFGLPLPGRRSRDAQRRVWDLVTMVGAECYAERPIGELSGGEQQRLLIAQALARDPRLLLLDEPLDSLDLPNQAAVAALISRIARTEGIAVLMVAHDVNPILGYLDQVVYLAGGRAASGSPHEVITSATLSGLYGTPVEVLIAADGRRVVVGAPEPHPHHGDAHGGDAAPGHVHDGHAHDDHRSSDHVLEERDAQTSGAHVHDGTGIHDHGPSDHGPRPRRWWRR